MVEKAVHPGTRAAIVILRVLVACGCGLIGLVGFLAGVLITDACPSPGGCSKVEAFALIHLPVQAVIAVAGIVASLKVTRPRYRIGALVAALAVSPVAGVLLHFAVADYMNGLPRVG